MTESGNNNKNYISSHNDEISLRELFIKLQEWWKYLLSKWLTIMIAGIIGGILGLAYAFWKKPSYTASLSFVLEEGKSMNGGLGQMTGLASMMGFNLGGMEGAGLFSGDNIMEFIKSRRMIQKTLLTEVNMDGKRQLLVDRYLEINDIRKTWEDNNKFVNFQFLKDTSNIFLQDSLLFEFQKDILENNLNIEKPDKKLSIIQLNINSTDEKFAMAFCETLIQNVTDFYILTRTKKSSENLAILTKQVDSVRKELNNAIGNVASALDNNPNANMAFQSLRVPSQRIQIDVQANTAILTELVKQQEVAKLAIRNDMPLIQMLDRPHLPLEVHKIGKVKGIILGSFITCFFSTLILVLRRALIDIMKE